MICVTHNHYRNALEKELVSAGYHLTKLLSSGGFMRKGNTTFLIGTNDEDMDGLLEKMKEICVEVETKKGKMKDDGNRFNAFIINITDSMSLLEKLNQ